MTLSDGLGVGAIVVAVVIGVPTLIYAAIAVRPARPHRLEYYYWRASTLLSLPARSSIDVRVNGKQVANAWQLAIRFVNSGKKPIRLEDWSSPISIKFPGGVEPISSTVSAVKESSLSPTTSVDGDVVLVEPILLNQGDMFELQIVGDGHGNYKSPLIEGRIANLPRFNRARFIYNPGNGTEGNFIRDDAVIWSVFGAAGLGLIALTLFKVGGLDLAGKLWMAGVIAVIWLVFIPLWLWAANKRRALWRPTKYFVEPAPKVEPASIDRPSAPAPLPSSGVKPRWRVMFGNPLLKPGELLLRNLASEKSQPRNVRLEASTAEFTFSSGAEWDVIPGGQSTLFKGFATEGGKHFGVDFEVHWFDDEGTEWVQEARLAPQRSPF